MCIEIRDSNSDEYDDDDHDDNDNDYNAEPEAKRSCFDR